MITEPIGWSVLCDSDECENFEGYELRLDDFSLEYAINDEGEFEDFIKGQGWAVVDDRHFCPECAKRMGLTNG